MFNKDMKKNILFILSFGLLYLSLFCPPDAMAQDNLEKEHLARWHINYASYLIDVGKYMEALENYETALEVTSIPKTKIDALLAKATLLSSFLDAPEDALKVYRQVRKRYPQAAEIAQYREGLLLFDLNRLKNASSVLKNYLKRYPRGRFQFQAEALLEEIKKRIPQPMPPKLGRPQVRVRLCKATREATIKGPSVCVAGHGCKKSIRVRASGGQILLDGSAIDGRQVIFESKGPMAITCGRKKKRVRGRLVARLKGNKLLIINLLDIEDYLLSVVPSESYSSWPIETLKAQAVCARTYAYYQFLHRKDWAYDLVDDEGDQAYKGVDRERPRSSRAVKKTSGAILEYHGRPIIAMYSANSGGYTADAGAIFSLHKPYLIAHPDPESLKGKMARWNKEYTVSETENALKKIGIKVNGLKKIEVAGRSPSGRIVKVCIVSQEGSRVFRTRTTLRMALKLPDILFQIQRHGDRFIFQGRGWGHGVGYSQWGSAYMGKSKDYVKILSFYYPGTCLEKMW